MAGAFERSQHDIDRGIVAPVLDQPAGVRRGGTVAAERAADRAEFTPNAVCDKYIALCRANAT